MKNPLKFELPQGTLDLVILRVVALAPVHGYAIAQGVRQICRDALQVQQCSLYPALHRLENKKLLAAELGPKETGRETKFYRLTTKGCTQLKAETDSWGRLIEVAGLILADPQGGEGMSWFGRLVRDSKMESELDRELRFHIESQLANKVIVMGTMIDAPMMLDHDQQRAKPALVTANCFTQLGASATVGRLLDPVREEFVSSSRVAVLSYRLWR